MRLLFRLLPAALASLLLLQLPAAGASATETLPASVRIAVERFLLAQAAGLPGQVAIAVAHPPAALPACAAPDVFLPAGVAPWGRIPVGVRCVGEQPWSRYLTVHVRVQGRYLSAATALEAGRVLGEGDLVAREGDLTQLPRSVVIDPAAALGRVLGVPLAAGAPLRTEALREPVVVQQGQNVRVTAQGDGFLISTEGRALNRAAAGAAVQVRTADGRLLNAVVRADGTAEVGR